MQLTEKEFDTIIKALENLPQKDDAGSFLSDIMGAMIFDNGHQKEMYEREREKKEATRMARKRKIKEETFILIGKVIQMKREAYPEVYHLNEENNG